MPASQPFVRTAAGAGFVVGTALFSGGVYGKVVTKEDKMGKAAPIGGIALIGTWLLIAVLRR